MAYSNSAAQAGYGSSLQINNGGASPPSWVTVGEVVDLTQANYENLTDDVTNLQSLAQEFIATLLNPGMWDFTVNRVTSDAGQNDLVQAFNTKVLKQYRVVLPLAAGQSTIGDSYVFYALVQKYAVSIKPDKKISISVSLKVSNATLFYAGS